MEQETLLPGETRLMPNQDKPFNADTFVAEQFLELRDRFKIETIVELGVAVGGSTKWMANHFENVHAIEINESFLNIAKQRCEGTTRMPQFYLGSTVDLLADVLAKCTGPVMIFIDSHWSELPLFDELHIIETSGLKPVIAIHDFKVPNERGLGFDSYNNVDISFENIKSFLDRIYGLDGYDYHYNTEQTSTEVKRGVIYIYPKSN